MLVLDLFQDAQFRDKTLDRFSIQTSALPEDLSRILPVADCGHDLVDGAVSAAPKPPDHIVRQQVVARESGVFPIRVSFELEPFRHDDGLRFEKAGLDGRCHGRW